MAATGHTVPSGRNMVTASPMPILQFLKAKPKALGTVQIIIGMVTLLFGSVLVSDPLFAPISVLSGNLYWASIAYIITGSLSVAAETRLHSCLVKGSLGMNVVSAIFSAVGIGVLIADLFLRYQCYPYEDCSRFEARSKAISAVLLVFTVLQFIISISISAYACKATCCTEELVPLATQVIYANSAAISSTQVPVTMLSSQAFRGNTQKRFTAHPSHFFSLRNLMQNPELKGYPQTTVLIPQAQVNMSSMAPQNVYDWNRR